MYGVSEKSYILFFAGLCRVVDEASSRLVSLISKMYQGLLVSVVLTGSRVGGGGSGSDLDIVVVYDELEVSRRGYDAARFEEELTEFVDEASAKYGFSGVKGVRMPPSSNQVDLLVLSLGRFWELLEERNPYILSYLESGVALVDEKFFTKLQRLYEIGLLKPNREAAVAFYEMATKRLPQARAVKLLILADHCYNVIMGSAIALLMAQGVRTHPALVHREFVKRFVETGLFDPDMAEWIRQVYDLRKGVERGEVLDVKGEEINTWMDRAEKFAKTVWAILTKQ